MTDDFIRVFEVAAPKTLENCKINLCSGVPDVVSLLPGCTTDNILEVLGQERMIYILKIPKENFAKLSLSLKSHSPAVKSF